MSAIGSTVRPGQPPSRNGIPAPVPGPPWIRGS